MSTSTPAGSRQYVPAGNRRSLATLAALALGTPLAVGILWVFEAGPLAGTSYARYVNHGVEKVEVVLFCCALMALLTKLLSSRAERAACRRPWLPPWDGSPVPVTEAGRLLEEIHGLKRGWQRTSLVRRIASVLDFVHCRGTANDLDDQIRTLADNDSIALEGSYSFIRFITWAIPILGFLGTVLGITQSIANVTPETLEKNLNEVTSGLALAFDATALGLGLTMLTMFLTFLVERVEQGVLEKVDHYADEQLAHRFERTGAEGGEFVAVVRQNTNVLLQATEQLVQKQASVWAKALEEGQRQWTSVGAQQQERITKALETALERTLASHAQRLAGLEKQMMEQSAALVQRLGELAAAVRDTGREQGAALAKVVQGMTAQTQALAGLQEGEKNLLRLQQTLNHNLAALNEAGAFEQAVHSLTAAIHLLTVKSGGATAPGVARPGARPGQAA
jgi:biopolymer transport protein ExbB/TolQ